ncbi:hypothetical protein KC336_g64 [Hortaea werneckii]|nr:hypothetical protein KC336_g64 [Hortaea werneckii]
MPRTTSRSPASPGRCQTRRLFIGSWYSSGSKQTSEMPCLTMSAESITRMNPLSPPRSEVDQFETRGGQMPFRFRH